MATAIFTVNITNVDADDRRAMKMLVEEENRRITGQNQNLVFVNAQRAQNVPPLTPIPDTPLLLLSTGGELKTSAESLYAKVVLAQHQQNIDRATDLLTTQKSDWKDIKELIADASPAQLAAAKAALVA